MENVANISSEEELLQLHNEGKISEAEYQDLLAAMRKPSPNENGDERIWRSGSILVMHRNAVLPDRCVKTNDTAQGRRLKRKLYWHHPALYLLIFVNILIYLIIAVVVRKKATIEIGVSENTLSKRKRAIIIMCVAVLTGISLLVLGSVATDYPHRVTILLLGLVVLLAVFVWADLKTRLIYPKRIETDYIWIKGVCEEYLASLPEWEKR